MEFGYSVMEHNSADSVFLAEQHEMGGSVNTVIYYTQWISGIKEFVSKPVFSQRTYTYSQLS